MAYTDPVIQHIRRDLRTLRRSMYPFSESEIASCLALVVMAGGGSPKVARGALSRIYEKYAEDPEDDITAYFETSGYDLPGETLDARLAAYAERHLVDPRTGRRRSDRGMEKVADLIWESADEFRPTIDLGLMQSGSWAHGTVTFGIAQGSWIQPVTITINEEKFENVELDWVETKKEPFSYGQAVFAIPPFEFSEPSEDSSILYSIEIHWGLSNWLVRRAGFIIADPWIMASVTTDDADKLRAYLLWKCPPAHVDWESSFLTHPLLDGVE